MGISEKLEGMAKEKKKNQAKRISMRNILKLKNLNFYELYLYWKMK